MRKLTTLFILLFALYTGQVAAQPGNRIKKADQAKTVPSSSAEDKKYPSLLWEITGNGLQQPSYLFGTMHVSDKLAFHLGDSFYNAIKSVDMVALETNPESWQDDYSNSIFFRAGSKGLENAAYFRHAGATPSDYMRITTFAIGRYEEAIAAALAVEPSMINGMLYRTYGGQMNDFEEDTFLDMYIFQVGKKLGKRVSGVEDFAESEKLVMEAYKDMLRDQHKKKRSYDYEGMMTNPKKIEDAYRKGDLDLLDSLERLTVFSEAFQEKFLYKRNEIQANSIDSIIKKTPLFAGVGAAHLPGKRGVIEMLRSKGYTLRPVLMDERNSEQKEKVDNIRTPNRFITQHSDDGFYEVAIPGSKFYRFTDWSGMDVVQYADMVNGAYYVVTRIKTNSFLQGHSNETAYKKADSLLYENIPGKILKKEMITRNGYKGFDITNRTRRGDHQRYQIFTTPFEIVIFKMSGIGEYVLGGDDAKQFFGSVRLKEYDSDNWLSWTPATGGFTTDWPHAPSLLHDNNYGTNRLEYAARDKQDGNSYLVMKVNLHNYAFIEEDTFELNLMDESYAYSSFIDKRVSRKFIKVNGYPALECKYRHHDGSYSAAKFVIRGPVYYAAVARYNKENAGARRFLNAFAITPFIYPPVKERTDTLLHITVKSPVYPENDKLRETITGIEDVLRMTYNDEAGSDYSGQYENRYIGNDSIGEKILVTYARLPKYSYLADSSRLWEGRYGDHWSRDSTFIYRADKKYMLPGGMQCRELQLTDTGSSRMFLVKSFYKDGYFFSVSTLTDTLSERSAFLENFFSSLRPADSLAGESLFTRKSEQFMQDLFSKDTVVSKRANASLYRVAFDSLDIPLLTKALDSLHWSIPGYLRLKLHFISALGRQKDTAVTDYLEKMYWKINDTSVLQNAILNALLNQRTTASFRAFSKLLLQEPPIIEGGYYDYEVSSYDVDAPAVEIPVDGPGSYYDYNSRWYPLFDTLALTKTIFPDLLPLLNIDDYRDEVMSLLVTMVDSGYLKAADYESWFSKIYIDGRQLLKKQLAREDKRRMEKAARKNSRPSVYSVVAYPANEEDDVLEAGNPGLINYAILLLPFRDKNPGVQTFFDRLMKTEDRRLLYNSFILLLRNKQKVPDSLFLKYATLDEYRCKLYEDLDDMDQLDKFPAAYKNQQAIARSLLYCNSGRYEKMDTLVYLDKLPVEYNHKKGMVYFYKYKRMPDDAEWQLASVGMQPEKKQAIDVSNDDFTTKAEKKLDNSEPVKVQLQKMLKEMLYSKRSSASMFYDARSYSIYKNYLPEMVKNRRYRD